MTQDPTRAAVAEQLSEALRNKDEGRYNVVAFVHRHVVIDALESAPWGPIKPVDDGLTNLSEALYVLSDRMRADGFLERGDNHEKYEAVVREYQALRTSIRALNTAALPAPASREAICRILEPQLFSDDPDERHRAASPLMVECAQKPVIAKAGEILALTPAHQLDAETVVEAAIELLKYRVGEQPKQGWLRDNDASRTALTNLARALKDTPNEQR